MNPKDVMKLATIALAMTASVGTATAAPRAKPNQRQIGDIAAQCAVEADRARVRALLSTLPGSAAERRVAKRLGETFEACSEGAYRLSVAERDASMFNGRADLAAAMVVAVAAGRVPQVKAAAWYVEPTRTAQKGDYDGFLLGVQEFGACVVAADAGDALKLVRADARSPDEQAAIAALRPVLAPCVGQGMKLNFTRDELRLAVAEPLYHALADDAPPVGVR